MSLEQVLADHSAALNNLAAAIREQIAGVAVGGPLVIHNFVEDKPKGNPAAVKPETIIVDQQPLTGSNPDTVIVDEIQTIVTDEPAAEVTYDEMRSAFMKVPSKCGADVAREILAKFSCTKVPQVPAEHYAEVKRLSEEALAKAGK